MPALDSALAECVDMAPHAAQVKSQTLAVVLIIKPLAAGIVISFAGVALSCYRWAIAHFETIMGDQYQISHRGPLGSSSELCHHYRVVVSRGQSQVLVGS